MDMRLELILLPSSDLERSKTFYRDQFGFTLDHDVAPGNGRRVIQLTPPGSSCSVAFGVGILTPDASPVHGTHLVVDDVEAARRALIENGVDVSEINDLGGGVR